LEKEKIIFVKTGKVDPLLGKKPKQNFISDGIKE